MSNIRDVLEQRWYSVVDDTIGGYAVANVNKPSSEIDTRGQVEREIMWGVLKTVADHVVELHNDWLANREEDENE